MRLRILLAWVILLALSFSPALLLFLFGPSDYSDTTHTLGQIAALVGVTMFALTFILSTRLKFIEDAFGGLDKVYVVHGITGGTALILILAHPILLVLKFIPTNIPLAAKYLSPGSHWSVNFGIIALVGMITLIFITLYTRMKYNRWKFTHEFLGLVFIIAIFHMVMVRGDAARDYIFHGYYAFVLVVSAIGLCCFSYSLFIKNRLFKEAIYSVNSIEQKKDVYELALAPERKAIEYKSGQFIFIRFYNEKLSKEAHPFSIASKSNNSVIKVYIKNLGDFTGKMHELKVGDKVGIEGPYGRFNTATDAQYQVWIAGGIGITPFIGMAEDIKGSPIKVDLYYSVRDSQDLIAENTFKDIAVSSKNFRFYPWVTNNKGHLSAGYILKNSGNFKGKEFFLCGPTGLKKSITAELLKSGVSRDSIHDEEFGFR